MTNETYHFRDKTDKRDPTGSSTPRSEYPNQTVIKTKSGITILMGNDKGKEFFLISHPGGSTMEFMPDGSVVSHTNAEKVDYNKGGVTSSIDENYDMKVSGHGKMQVSGGMHIEVAGDAGIVVAGDVMLAGMKDFGMMAKNVYMGARGNFNLNVEGDTNITTKGTTQINSTKSMALKTDGNMSRTASGDMSDNAASIDHNGEAAAFV